jgi:hypothetical protein
VSAKAADVPTHPMTATAAAVRKSSLFMTAMPAAETGAA